jgi:cysteinyl-tRNA synthetase
MEKLRLYNTLTRKKEEFKPIHKGKVGMYTCGPTVYWYQHIGNLRSYIFADILKRVLLYNGFKVKHVINVTDVGHLTSDADTGEDKIEKAAKRERKTAKEISNFYFKVFREDFKKLNILEPDVWPKATEHIKEMMDMIKILKKKGYTYTTSDGIYFDTSKFKGYGKLGKIRVEKLKAGKRVEMREKRNKTDFALWKFSEKPGERQQEWKFMGRVGFPGWHIECSAMSSKYLGKQFDIHTGGEDHIQVHHTNEIAQSEASFGIRPWVRYWLHGAFLTTGGEKVSKSKGGLYTIAELEDMGFEPLIYRYFVLSTHYRKPLEFSIKNLNHAKKSYERLKNIISEIKDDKNINKKYLERFEKAINNDLDIPSALSVLWKLVRDKKAKGKIKTIKKMDSVLGLDLLKKEKIKIPEKVRKLVAEREKLRKEKEWKKADEVREEIKKLGFLIDDTPKGSKLKKLN